jgi:sirohydrochlorin cobaltochelatase
MKKRRIVGLAIVLGLLLTVPALAAGHGHKREMKKGILLVAFGTSVPSAQVSFQNIEKKVKVAFPDIPMRWAYTSKIIRDKLAKTGQHLDSPETALAKMMDEGFTHVAVQSLHTIAGEEFHDLRRNAHAFAGMAGGFERILVGYPLLGTQKDLERVVAAMIKNIPKERKKSEAVVLMGHGTPHPSNAFYAAMMFHFQQQDPNIFVGTVEGSPKIDAIKSMLLKKKIKKAYLIPFMSVAGDHAMNDMAGDEADSWKSILTSADITCVPVMKGTAEYDDIVAIWVDHLGNVLAHF